MSSNEFFPSHLSVKVTREIFSFKTLLDYQRACEVNLLNGNWEILRQKCFIRKFVEIWRDWGFVTSWQSKLFYLATTETTRSPVPNKKNFIMDFSISKSLIAWFLCWGFRRKFPSDFEADTWKRFIYEKLFKISFIFMVESFSPKTHKFHTLCQTRFCFTSQDTEFCSHDDEQLLFRTKIKTRIFSLPFGSFKCVTKRCCIGSTLK